MRSFTCGMALVLLTELTTADRQTVAAAEASPAESANVASNESESGGASIRKTLDRLPSLGNFATQIQQLATLSSEKSNVAPATVVWVRLSKGYLADYVERTVDRKKPVRDCILRTTIYGESHITGHTRLVLHASDNQARGEVEFVGNIRARGTGYNGPAILQYRWTSTFRARKPLAIGDASLSASPAIADASTRLMPVGLRANRPGLRGRIIERIAWRRVAKTRSQADAIASDHTANDIRHDLDRKVNDSVAAIQAKVRSQLAQLQLNGEEEPTVMRSRSTPDYVEVAMFRSDADIDDVKMPPSPIEGNPGIAVRVHRTFLAAALADPQLREKITPLLIGAVAGSVVEKTEAAENTQPQLDFTNWSMGPEWLALDFAASTRAEPSPRIALEENLQESRIK